jgi:hypothetical protein
MCVLVSLLHATAMLFTISSTDIGMAFLWVHLLLLHLLLLLLQVPDRLLFVMLMSGAEPGSPHESFLAERAELLLVEAAR